MTEFDLYAFADYSGSKYEYQQRKAIALSVIDNNKKSKNHLQDAEACSKWLYEQDKKSRLLDWLDPDNFKLESRNELQRASLEGWIIGVR